MSDTELALFEAENIKTITSLAKILAQGTVALPKHFHGKDADVFAVCLQAAQWQMNPIAVMQKTFVINGALAYESQLVNAVIQNSGMVTGSFKYEFRDEPLACRVGAILKGDTEITWGQWLDEGSVQTRNSPLWKTNPRQQLAYLQVKNWARLYAPGAILGVYTPDEIEAHPVEKDITPEAVPDKTVSIESLVGEVIEPAQEDLVEQPSYAQFAAAINASKSAEESADYLNQAREVLGADMATELVDVHLAKWKKEAGVA